MKLSFIVVNRTTPLLCIRTVIQLLPLAQETINIARVSTKTSATRQFGSCDILCRFSPRPAFVSRNPTSFQLGSAFNRVGVDWGVERSNWRALSTEEGIAENRYSCDYARLGTSGCKKCKAKLAKGSLRLAKVRVLLQLANQDIACCGMKTTVLIQIEPCLTVVC